MKAETSSLTSQNVVDPCVKSTTQQMRAADLVFSRRCHRLLLRGHQSHASLPSLAGDCWLTVCVCVCVGVAAKQLFNDWLCGMAQGDGSIIWEVSPPVALGEVQKLLGKCRRALEDQ